MNRVKTIMIDQLKPGMFIVGMDQPWHRTPFLFHKRLIRHQEDIDLLRRHGIKKVKIDPNRDLDLEADSSEEALQPDGAEKNTEPLQPPGTQKDSLPSDAQDTAAAPHPSHEVKPTLLEEAPQPARNAEGNAAQLKPPVSQEELPQLNVSMQAVAAQATYTEAICSMERMFEELEAGIIPRPNTLRIVVTNVLSRVLDDSASMLSLLFLQKMQRFDRTMASHALDICILSLIVAHAYGVAEGELEALGAGALLHDIGYIRLPRNLYRKSHDLTEQECTMMQQHPALGLAILRDAKEDRDAVVRIVVEHHECINGSGFPHNLKGGSLSVLAQLVGLVDTYDGMVSHRGGRPAMLPHDAIRQLFRLGDTGRFVKDLIQAVISSVGVYPIGSLVLLNTAEQAVVVRMNSQQRLKPVVKVITGPQGGSYLTPIRVDLGAQAAGASVRTITKVLDPVQERVNVAMFLDGIHEEAV
jgi:putative nucleotidyltransferase with HDIG domain